MVHRTCTRLREVVSSVHQLKVAGFPITTTEDDSTGWVRSWCTADGHGWEIRYHPALYVFGHRYCPGLSLIFLGEPPRSAAAPAVPAILSGRITTHSMDADFAAFMERKTVPKAFRLPLDRSPPLYLGVGSTKPYDDFRSPSLTVECTITVFREPEPRGAAIADLSRHLGELLRSEAGADVTFAVSGETFAAHKVVLAARSPVFMAEFFRDMKEKDARHVEIQDMDAAAFTAMLHFIYTDAVPELDERPEVTATALAQHLLVAADRYGLDRLKLMCESRLAIGMDAGTVASTLALAEQHGCSRLKAKCIEFIAGGSQENLDAMLATVGYKHLVASSPSVLAELLKAAHGKKRSRLPDDEYSLAPQI